jgi:hypothetical protein
MVRVDVEALISKLETGLVKVRVEVMAVNVEMVEGKGVNLATVKMVILNKQVHKVFMSKK